MAYSSSVVIDAKFPYKGAKIMHSHIAHTIFRLQQAHCMSSAMLMASLWHMPSIALSLRTAPHSL